MDLTDLVKAIKESGKKTQAYDTQATVRRIEGNTAWVHIPGGVDETPVKMTVKAKPGDTVQIRVGGGKAWITGNATAPPTDDSLAKHVDHNLNIVEKVVSKVKEVAEKASAIAATTSQYFWFTQEDGAHITEKPQAEFEADPENGGGNLLATSNGVAVRDGTTDLATFSGSEIELGKNSQSSVIKFVNSKFRMSAAKDRVNGLTAANVSAQETYNSSDPSTGEVDLTLSADNTNGSTTKHAAIEIKSTALYNQSFIGFVADYLRLYGGSEISFQIGNGDLRRINDAHDLFAYDREADTETDADDFLRNGLVRLPNSHGYSNVPITNACFVFTLGSSNTNKIQFCTAANVSDFVLHMRKCSGGTWGSWKSKTFS